MSVKTWNGATAEIYTAADWSPVGVPVAGDIGVVAVGAVLADGLTLDGFALRLAGNGIGVAPTLELTGTTLGPLFSVTARYAGSSGAAPTAQIDVNGIDNNAGQIVAGTVKAAASLQILLGSPNTELVNTGRIVAEPGSTIGITAGQVVNNGQLVADGGSVTLNTQITGTGTMLIERGGGQAGTVTAEQIVGNGQTVLMHGGTLALASPHSFLGMLQGWDSGTLLDLLHTHLTAVDVTAGHLVLHDGSFTEGDIKLAGHYSSSDFHFVNEVDGSALITTSHTGAWS